MPNTSRSTPTISIAWLYVLAGLVVLFLSVMTIVALSITRPELDMMVVSAVVFAFGSTMFTAIISAIKGQENQHKINELGIRVDGKLSKLLEETERRAKMEGQAQGLAAATGQVPLPPPVTPTPVVVTPTPPKNGTLQP